jgi:hypothetical protein
VLWYFTDLPWLDVPTPFVSAIWSDPNGPRSGMNRGYLGQGEQLDSDPVWRNGDAPFAPGFPPGHYCGTPEQWAGNLRYAVDGEATTDEEGRPTCCGSPPPPQDACPLVEGVADDSYSLACSVPVDGTLPVSRLGGFWSLARPALGVNYCQWRSPIVGAGPALSWGLTRSASGWRIAFFQNATIRNLSAVFSWDGHSDIEVAVSGLPFGDFPPTVTLKPFAPS